MMDLEVTTLKGDKKHLTVDFNATLGELKQMILRDFSVDPSQQKLSANNGQKIILDNDSRSLSSYGLHSGSTVMLIIKPMEVFVKNANGQTGTYEVDADETVDQLQLKIYNKVRIPVDQQWLKYNGKPLVPGIHLKDYNITPKSTIDLALRLKGG